MLCLLNLFDKHLKIYYNIVNIFKNHTFNDTNYSWNFTDIIEKYMSFDLLPI